MPISDIETRQKVYVNYVIVWASGRISHKVEEQIMHEDHPRYRNVTFRDGDATIELVDRHYPEYYTIGDYCISEYYTAAKEYFSSIEELRALGASSEHHQLPVIFVPPTLIPLRVLRTTFQIGKLVSDPKATAQKIESLAKQLVSFGDFLSASQNSVVVGDIGSGKSTLLRRLLLKIIEDNEKALRCFPIPILVEVKRLDLSDEKGIERALYRQFIKFSSDRSEQEIESDLTAGEIVVLLDGLDELQTEERITQALERIESFSRQYQ